MTTQPQGTKSLVDEHEESRRFKEGMLAGLGFSVALVAFVWGLHFIFAN